MPYPQLRTSGAKTYSPQLIDADGNPAAFPEGTLFSAFTSDFSIATASADSDGLVTVTPNGDVTGNVFVNLSATIPGNAADISGTILVHIMDAPLTEKEYVVLSPS